VFVHGLFGPFSDPALDRELAPAACSAPPLVGYGAGATPPRADELRGQADALRSHIRIRHGDRPVHLVAHSVGAVTAFELAGGHPDLVASVTSVEGNFSLADAFWSRSIASLGDDEARREISARLADALGFLASDGILPSPALVEAATAALAYQPWQTVLQTARIVVEKTGVPEYEALLRRVFAAHPVHLVEGERSGAAWHVPAWARAAAARSTVVPGGHLMMIEHPAALGRALAAVLEPPPTPPHHETRMHPAI
jgi:pimeloyl-ACP methyl ester carboxylesterase